MRIDTLAVIAALDRYVLPPFIAAVVIAAWRQGRRATTPAIDAPAEAERLDRLDRERMVRRIGLLNYGLALRAAVLVLPALQAYYDSGSFHSWTVLLDLGRPVVVVLANVAIGFGLRRLRPWARWTALVWNLLLTLLAYLVVTRVWRYGAAIAFEDWPAIALTMFLPPLLLAAMLWPGTARVVSAEHRMRIAATPRVSSWPVRRSLLSALVAGFLVLVASDVVVDAFDWAVRIRPELNAAAGP